MDRRPTGARYEICIQGLLPDWWASWFDGFTIERLDCGETRLTGWVEDSSALYGLIDRLRDLNLKLVSVREQK